MQRFSLVQIAPIGGDCTAPYEVLLYNKPVTVAEFVNEVLQITNEWGYISVHNIRKCPHPTKINPEIEYRDGKIIESTSSWRKTIQSFPIEIANAEIKRASACGGWSRMDYDLYIEIDEPETEKELYKDSIIKDVEDRLNDALKN